MPPHEYSPKLPPALAPGAGVFVPENAEPVRLDEKTSVQWTKKTAQPAVLVLKGSDGYFITHRKLIGDELNFLAESDDQVLLRASTLDSNAAGTSKSGGSSSAIQYPLEKSDENDAIVLFYEGSDRVSVTGLHQEIFAPNAETTSGSKGDAADQAIVLGGYEIITHRMDSYGDATTLLESYPRVGAYIKESFKGKKIQSRERLIKSALAGSGIYGLPENRVLVANLRMMVVEYGRDNISEAALELTFAQIFSHARDEVVRFLDHFERRQRREIDAKGFRLNEVPFPGREEDWRAAKEMELEWRKSAEQTTQMKRASLTGSKEELFSLERWEFLQQTVFGKQISGANDLLVSTEKAISFLSGYHTTYDKAAYTAASSWLAESHFSTLSKKNIYRFVLPAAAARVGIFSSFHTVKAFDEFMRKHLRGQGPGDVDLATLIDELEEDVVSHLKDVQRLIEDEVTKATTSTGPSKGAVGTSDWSEKDNLRAVFMIIGNPRLEEDHADQSSRMKDLERDLLEPEAIEARARLFQQAIEALETRGDFSLSEFELSPAEASQ